MPFKNFWFTRVSCFIQQKIDFLWKTHVYHKKKLNQTDITTNKIEYRNLTVGKSAKNPKVIVSPHDQSAATFTILAIHLLAVLLKFLQKMLWLLLIYFLHLFLSYSFLIFKVTSVVQDIYYGLINADALYICGTIFAFIWHQNPISLAIKVVKWMTKIDSNADDVTLSNYGSWLQEINVP